jgi:hypothetical protein
MTAASSSRCSYAAASVTDEPVDAFIGRLENDREQSVTLRSPFAGLHWIDSYGPSLAVDFPDGQPITVPCDIKAYTTYHIWSLYFYVPRGTKTIGGFASANDGRIRDGDGNDVFSFKTLTGPGYFNVPVPAGLDGKLWLFEKCRGRRMLLTVPPYLARSAEELLLPREVVERDSR